MTFKVCTIINKGHSYPIHSDTIITLDACEKSAIFCKNLKRTEIYKSYQILCSHHNALENLYIN